MRKSEKRLSAVFSRIFCNLMPAHPSLILKKSEGKAGNSFKGKHEKWCFVAAHGTPKINVFRHIPNIPVRTERKTCITQQGSLWLKASKTPFSMVLLKSSGTALADFFPVNNAYDILGVRSCWMYLLNYRPLSFKGRFRWQVAMK